MLVGTLDNVECFSVMPGCDLDALSEQVSASISKSQEDGVIVFSDLFFGTPFNILIDTRDKDVFHSGCPPLLLQIHSEAMNAPASLMQSLLNSISSFLGQPVAAGENYMVLAKTPEVFEHLINCGITFSTLVVGGMGAKPGRKTLYRNLSAETGWTGTRNDTRTRRKYFRCWTEEAYPAPVFHAKAAGASAFSGLSSTSRNCGSSWAASSWWTALRRLQPHAWLKHRGKSTGSGLRDTLLRTS